jgi:hypothetical protein
MLNLVKEEFKQNIQSLELFNLFNISNKKNFEKNCEDFSYIFMEEKYND